MTSKTRVLNSLVGKKIDKIPIFATVTPQIGEKLIQLTNSNIISNVRSGMKQRIIYVEALNQLGNDCVGVASCFAEYFASDKFNDNSYNDEWNIRWINTGLYDEMVYHPLAEIETISELNEYNFPDLGNSDRYVLASEMTAKYGDDYAIVGMQDSVNFELAWYLTGMEKFLADILEKKEYVQELLKRILEIKIIEAKKLIDLGIDILWTGDDIGDQNGMILSPALWRGVLKPHLAIFINTLHQYNPKIKIAYHSCGSILPVIPDLIEIGVDILNPIQTNVKGMDPIYLKSSYGDKLVFFGGIDVQNLLPKGSPEKVYTEVQKIISILGLNGAYIAAPSHNIQPDTPIENIFAMYKAINDYRMK